MAQAVIEHHGAESDRAEWRRLVLALQACGEKFAEVDAEDLAEAD